MIAWMTVMLGCGAAGPPPVDLPEPWSVVETAVADGTVHEATAQKLVLYYPASAPPGPTGQRHAEALRAAGWTVGEPVQAGPVLLWSCAREGRDLTLASVPKKDRVEIHLDL